MTNFLMHRERKYAAIPLRLSVGAPEKKIVAMTQHGDRLVLGLEPPHLMSMPFIFMEDGNIEIGQAKLNQLKTKGVTINSVKSYHSHFLVHLVKE